MSNFSVESRVLESSSLLSYMAQFLLVLSFNIYHFLQFKKPVFCLFLFLFESDRFSNNVIKSTYFSVKIPPSSKIPPRKVPPV